MKGEGKEMRTEKAVSWQKETSADTASGYFKARPKRGNGHMNHKQMESLEYSQYSMSKDLHRSYRDNNDWTQSKDQSKQRDGNLSRYGSLWLRYASHSLGSTDALYNPVGREEKSGVGNLS